MDHLDGVGIPPTGSCRNGLGHGGDRAVGRRAAHCPDTCVSGGKSGTLYHPLARAIIRGNADAVRLFLRRCPVECVSVDAARAVTVAHLSSTAGYCNEPVESELHSAHEVFHTEAVLEAPRKHNADLPHEAALASR